MLRIKACAHSRCLIPGMDLPELSGQEEFLAVENFYWTAKALELHEHASLQELYDAGIRWGWGGGGGHDRGALV